jgi:hypothetical protein
MAMDLGFNPYAFVNPRTKEEYSALLDEALRMAEDLEEMIDQISDHLERNAKRKSDEA